MRYTQQKYSGVKRIYHDIDTGATSYERLHKAQTCFDSQQEFKTYILLEEYFTLPHFTIEVHPTLCVGNVTWKIDFSVLAKSDSRAARMALAKVVNTLHDTEHIELSRIFVEYKGLQDNNFLMKMGNVITNAPAFSKTIVLVSDHISAFGCYDREKMKFHCHPITSLAILESILRTCI